MDRIKAQPELFSFDGDRNDAGAFLIHRPEWTGIKTRFDNVHSIGFRTESDRPLHAVREVGIEQRGRLDRRAALFTDGLNSCGVPLVLEIKPLESNREVLSAGHVDKGLFYLFPELFNPFTGFRNSRPLLVDRANAKPDNGKKEQRKYGLSELGHDENLTQIGG